MEKGKPAARLNTEEEKKHAIMEKLLSSYGALTVQQRKKLREFDKENATRNITIMTRLNYVRFVSYLGDYCARNGINEWKGVTKKDVLAYLGTISEKSLAYSNLSKICIKVFFRWLYGEKEYPAVVAWIQIRSTPWRELKPTEIIKKEDVEKLLNYTEHPRNKALIVLLWESGCRIGELLNLKIKDLTFTDGEAWINVTGKTGPRPILLYDSIPFLKQLIDTHPQRDNGEAYLFFNRHGRPFLTEMAVWNMLTRLGKKAGINKPLNPHSWRHAACTAFMHEGYNEQEAQLRFGWTRKSRMASRYSHLSQDDLATRIRIKRGIVKQDVEEKTLGGRVCYACKKRLPLDAKVCECGYILDKDLAQIVKLAVAASVKQMKSELEQVHRS